MKTAVKNCAFNTDMDTEVGRLTQGEFGDNSGYEEILYKTEKGQYYLCGKGGDDSKYPSPIFKVMKKAEALAWLGKLDEVSQISLV